MRSRLALYAAWKPDAHLSGLGCLLSLVDIFEEGIFFIRQIFEARLNAAIEHFFGGLASRTTLLVQPHNVDLEENADNNHSSEREDARADAKSLGKVVSKTYGRVSGSGTYDIVEAC